MGPSLYRRHAVLRRRPKPSFLQPMPDIPAHWLVMQQPLDHGNLSCWFAGPGEEGGPRPSPHRPGSIRQRKRERERERESSAWARAAATPIRHLLPTPALPTGLGKERQWTRERERENQSWPSSSHKLHVPGQQSPPHPASAGNAHSWAWKTLRGGAPKPS